ncbi:MAG: NlpC/P60 family protein [Kiloniellales bacterium]|nr:NlpC/P60 family protein [Kiloniellales bacterium]
MSSLDPRLHPFRDDLAAAYLKDRVAAVRYVEGKRQQVARGILDLRRAPRDDAPLDSQLLYGEAVNVYDVAKGWAWVQSAGDGYVGYVAAAALSAAVAAPTHSLAALRSYLFAEPDFKAPTLDLLSMASPLAVVEQREGFARLAGGGWVFGRHLVPLGATVADYVETALAFLGTPYLWGGRSSVGIDCSALVQIALARAGVFALRDTHMQEEILGEPLAPAAAIERGDLVFLPEHVAIAVDPETVVHATALHMAVALEPLAELEARARKANGQGITGVRRPRVRGRDPAE